MEINSIILFIDILGSLGFGYYFSKDIKRDLRKAGQIGGYMPTIVFVVSLIPCFLNMGDKCLDLIVEQFINLFVGYFAGVVSSGIAGIVGDAIKTIIGRIR